MEKRAVPNKSQEMIYGKQFCGCHIQANSGSLNSTKNGKQWQILFSWAPKSLRTVTAAMQLKHACSLERKL